MQSPAIPEDEAQRLDALRDLRILDTSAEDRFDRITRVAKQVFDVPIALVSLVDADRQWFKSRQGLDAAETPRGVSFCGHAILSDRTFVINDARADPRFADNPLVTGPPHVCFYAGQPLKAADGSRIGTLCIIDRQPRDFPAAAQALLADLAVWVERELTEKTLAEAVAYADASQRQLWGVINASTQVAIIATEPGGMITVFNTGAERMLGYSAAEMVGKQTPAIIHLESEVVARGEELTLEAGRRIVGFDAFVEYAREGRHDQREWTYVRKDGSTLTVDLVVTAIRDSAGKITGFLGVANNITERKLAESEIRSRENRIRALFDTIVDGIIVINSRGRIHSMNPAAQTLFGYAPDEMLGQNIKMLMPQPYAREHDGYLYNYLSTGVKKIIGIGREVKGRRKDGSTFPMELAVSEMEVNGQRMFTGVVRDITERKAVERLKSEFISTVSHELRTPLTSIMGSLELIAKGVVGQLPPQAVSLIEIAQKNSARLVRLINDILDIDKIESGSMRFDKRTHEVRSLVAQAIDVNRDYALRFGVNLVVAREMPDVLIEVDADRLLQALTNLLSNAAKFSPAGADVTAAVDRADDRVRISVTDRGPGISPEFAGKIFQKFSQADSSDTRQKGGSGLGLNITKAIVEHMGGLIGFTSQPGAGATFYIEFPAAKLLPAASAPAGTRPTGKARVLICEDDRDVATLLQMMLGQAGYDADVAYDADGAKRMLDERTYAALTVDIGLPGQNGLDLIRELRAHNATTHVPIVVVSANAERGRQKLGGTINIVDWIDKPIDHGRLIAALRHALQDAVARPRILHIEDDVDVVTIVGTLLRPDYDVQFASTLADARRALQQQRFSLVILDMILPDGCGSELFASLQELKDPPPVVIFSATDQRDEMPGIIAAALVKSQTSNEKLVQTIRRLTSPPARAPESAEANA